MTVTTSTRLGLTLWSDDDDPWSREQITANFQALEDYVTRSEAGTAANRPAAGIARRLYLATDTKVLSLDTGSAWRVIATLDTANTWDLAQTFTAAIKPDGGIAPTDGQLEITGDVAVSGKFAANGATAQARAGATAEIKAALVAFGLLTDGGATPLDLDGGTLTAGAGSFSGAVTANGGITATDGQVELTGDLAVSGKFGVNGATAQGRAGATAEIKAALVAFGLLTDGSATPLDLDGGALSAGTGSFTGAVTVTGALKAEGGIAPTDGSLEITGTVSATGAITAQNGLSLSDGKDLTVGTGTGSKIGQSTSKLGFYGAAPVARPGTYNLTGSVDRTLGAYASDPESAAYTGATDGEAKLADLNALRTAYETLRVYVEDLAGVVIGTATDLKTLGLVG